MTQSLNPSIWRVLLPPVFGATEAPDAQTARAYKIAAADPKVFLLTRQCVNELLRLVNEAAHDHMLHAAVMGAATGDTTPAQWLEVQLGMLRAEIELSGKERATAADRRRAERDAARPLFEAVNRVSFAATSERDALLRRLQAQRADAPRKSRWTELRGAGLSEEEIARLELKPEDAEEERQATAWRERIAALDAQLAKCRAYGEDPLHDPGHVRGLGFDDLVDAHRAGTAVAA